MCKGDNIKKCNCCGRIIDDNSSHMSAHHDFLLVKKEWGYFSNKDMTEHRFIICEDCYDKWIESFKLPVEEFVTTELFKGIS
ncbi:hypothetical protein [Candidatus Epulonipiscium viviparus]|uniref:hypothetical protein n=1 Tax=Candidatus Epulonipiscium viviparus TaxID=420336 RepID=UPI00016BFC86|nr:hypothetical protein [Candidatus Epulopiscium viviparus]